MSSGAEDQHKPPEFSREKSMYVVDGLLSRADAGSSKLDVKNACCADNRFNALITLVDRHYEFDEGEKDVEKIIERNPALKRMEEERKEEELMQLRKERSVTSAIARRAREAVNSGEYAFWKL